MRLAIVIPTLNEEGTLPLSLPRAMEAAEEVVVSDGGSDDSTAELARSLGARVVSGPPGRGTQLNRGVRETRSGVLLFLHADTLLPATARDLVDAAVAEGAVGGGFRVAYDDARPLLRLAGRLINLRSRLTGCPLGDQAQFSTRAAWDALGGFREIPILEDLDMIRRLKRHGRTVILDAAVVTSARRILGQGVVRGTVTNYLIWALYFAGVDPHRLARLYRQVR